MEGSPALFFWPSVGKLGWAERQKVLGAFHRLAQAAKEFLQIVTALDEINLRSIHNEQIRS
jgi:hypothetical protein